MKGILITISIALWALAIAVVLTVQAQQTDHAIEILAADPVQVIVTLKEKYGAIWSDTGTVLSQSAAAIIVTHRDRPNTEYPRSEFAIVRVDK